MNKISFILVFCFTFFSCQKKFNMPEYEDVMMTSNTYNLPFNINFTSETFPQNLKRIVQKKDDEILNILEYDKSGNLIFKYYRQYVSDNWNGKYLTIIERNTYDANNRMIQRIILHSNTGADKNLYEYDFVGNLKLVLKTHIEASGINDNPWRYIENIKTFTDFDEDKNVGKIQQKKDFSKEVYEYDSEKNQVKNYFYERKKKPSNFYLYKFENDKLISKILYEDETIDYSNSYFLSYQDNVSIKTIYDNNKKISNIIKETNGSSEKIIEDEGKEYNYLQKKVFKGKVLISLYNKNYDNNEEDTEKYELDKYNLPVKMIHQSALENFTIVFTNDYTFYQE